MTTNQFPMIIDFSLAEVETSVHERFSKVARQFPENIAVAAQGKQLSYLELDHVSNQIGALLVKQDISKGKLVGLLLEQTPLAIAALLGILKAGLSFVIFYPDFPVEQIRSLWEASARPYLLTDSNLIEKTLQISSDFLNLDEEDFSLSISKPILEHVEPSSLAAVFFTSGTTGQPKGVMWSHRLILHTAFQNHDSYQISTGDRMGMLASFGFGAAMTQTFAAILSGASLRMLDVQRTSFSTLLDWLRFEKISILAMPPIGLFRQLLDTMKDHSPLSEIRLVLLGGDAFYKADVIKFRQCFPPDTLLVYRFSGSEIMLIRELKIQPDTSLDDEKVSVGYPVSDKEVILLDENRKPVPINTIGEIAVRSRYLASGYWENQTLTSQYFLPDPDGTDQHIYLTGDLGKIDEKGMLTHLGRKDLMVKIRGFSVQLEVIENQLQKLDGIERAVVASHLSPSGDVSLVAYLIAKGGLRITSADLRKLLAEHLPSHMIPNWFMWVDEIPQTATGKVDRTSLPSPILTRLDLKTPYCEPRTETEKKLCQIWQELLNISTVGIDDDFFELGGDSLLSLRMSIQAESFLKRTIPPAFFDKPTISHLIHCIEQQPVDFKLAAENDYSSVPTFKKKDMFSFRNIAFSRSRNNKKKTNTYINNMIGIIFDLPTLLQPYEKGIRWINWMLGNPHINKMIYRKKYSDFLAFVQGQGWDQETIDKKFKAQLTGDYFRSIIAISILNDDSIKLIDRFRSSHFPFWRSLAEILESAPMELLDKYFSINGLEILKEAYHNSRGVIILTFHTSVNRLAIAALPRRLKDVEYIQTISQKIGRQRSESWELDRGRSLPANKKSPLFASVAIQGKQLLEQGRIVQFVSDSFSELDGMAVEIAGKNYNFKPGFAELALNTGALIVPQISLISEDNHIHTTFFPPFDVPEGTRTEKIESLMSQYAAYLNFCWKKWPESLNPSRIHNHLFRKEFLQKKYMIEF